MRGALLLVVALQCAVQVVAPPPSDTPTSSMTTSSTASSSATPSITATISDTATSSITASSSETASITASFTPTISDSASLTATSSMTPSSTATSSMTSSSTASSSATPSISASPVSPSMTPSNSLSPSVSPSVMASPSVSSSNGASPSVSATMSVSKSPSNGASVSASGSRSPSVTPSRSASPSRTGSRSPTKSITPSVTASSTVSPTRTPSATATVTSANTQIADATVQFAVAIAGLAAPTAAPSANPGSLVVTSLASDATAGYALRASTYCELAQSGTPVAMSSILVTSATSSTGTVYFGPTDTVNSLNTVPVCPSPEPVPVSRRLSAAVEAAAAPVLAASASRGGVGARSLQSVPSTSVVIGMALSLVSPVNPATATSASALYQLATFYTSSAALGNVVAAAVANGDAASVVDALLLYLAAQAQLGVGAASASSPVNAFGANPAPAVLINSAVLVNTEAAAAAQQEDADAERIYRRNAVIGGCAGVAGFIIVVVLIYEFAVRRPRVAQAVADAKAHEAEMDKARAQAVADAAAGKPGPKAATLRPTGANGADVAAALSDLTIAVAGEASAAAVAGKAKAGLGQPQEVVVADLGAFGVLITDGKAAPIAGSLAATTLPVNETQVQLTSLSIAVNAEGSAAAAKRAYADGSGYATLVAAEAAAAQAAKTRGPSAAEPVAINASTPASVQKAAADLAAYGVV